MTCPTAVYARQETTAIGTIPGEKSYNLQRTTWDLKLFLFFIRRGNFQDGEEGFLRDVDLADALHAALAFFLFFEKFAFAGNVAAVALGENIFANRRHGFARDDAAA